MTKCPFMEKGPNPLVRIGNVKEPLDSITQTFRVKVDLAKYMQNCKKP